MTPDGPASDRDGSSDARPPAVVVLTVGAEPFTSADLEAAETVARVRYGARDGLRALAHADLIRGAVNAQALAANGAPLTEDDLKAEADRMLAEVPQIARPMLEACGGDRVRFARLALRGDLAEGRLQETFAALDGVQDDLRAEAERMRAVLAEAGAGDDWSARAADSAWRHFAPGVPHEIVALELVGPEGMMPEPGEAPPDPTALNPVEAAAIRSLQPGAVSPVLDQPRCFEILRLAPSDDGEPEQQRIERLLLPKLDPRAWVLRWASDLKIRVADPALQEDVTNVVPWLNELNITQVDASAATDSNGD